MRLIGIQFLNKSFTNADANGYMFKHTFRPVHVRPRSLLNIKVFFTDKHIALIHSKRFC